MLEKFSSFFRIRIIELVSSRIGIWTCLRTTLPTLSACLPVITSLHHFWFVFIAWRRILKEKIASKPISLASKDELSLSMLFSFRVLRDLSSSRIDLFWGVDNLFTSLPSFGLQEPGTCILCYLDSYRLWKTTGIEYMRPPDLWNLIFAVQSSCQSCWTFNQIISIVLSCTQCCEVCVISNIFQLPCWFPALDYSYFNSR